MVNQRRVPDFGLINGSDSERPFQEFLADFNILAIRRVPVPSHGSATGLLRRLLANNRGVDDATVRGFDIRSPDARCDEDRGAHIVFQEQDLMTICDSDCNIFRQFEVDGDDRLFVIRSDRRVIDAGSIREIDPLSLRLILDAAGSPQPAARAPPTPFHAAARTTAA